MPITDEGETVTSAQLQSVWEPISTSSTIVGSENTFTHAASASLTSAIQFPTNLIPVSGNKNAQLHIDNLTFNVNGTSVAVTDYDIPILDADGKQISFEANNSYTIKSYLTSKKTLKFAYSNIFWDGAGMNFYTTQGQLARDNGNGYKAVTTTDPQRYQGLYFRYASLVGAGGATNVSSGSTYTLYYPNYNASTNGSYKAGQSYAWHQDDPYSYQDAEATSAGGKTNDFATSEWVGLYHSPDENYNGDVCAYITNGAWRLPTADEFYTAGFKGGGTAVSNGLILSGTNGMTLLPASGAGAANVTWGNAYLPASGYLNTGTQSTVGQSGIYLTSSYGDFVGDGESSSSEFWSFQFGSGNDPNDTYAEMPTDKQVPVRCVKNTAGINITDPEDGADGSTSISPQ